MAINFQQTDAFTGCSASGARRDALDGGTAGSSAVSLSVAGDATDSPLLRVTCFVDTGVTWAAGTWTVRLNVTTANMFVSWASATIIRVNASCVVQETLGEVTGLGISLAATGVQSTTVSGSAATPSADDRILVDFGFANGSMNAQSFEFTPDQLIDSPFTEAAAEGEGDGDSAGVATVAGVGAAIAAATGTAAGIASVAGIGAAAATSIGAAAGTVTVSGIGAAGLAAAGAAAGAATTTATGEAIVSATASVDGAATVAGIGAATVDAVAASAGIAAVSAIAEIQGDLFLRPESTDSAGGWLTELGGTDLHNSIDDVTIDDADYIRSESDPVLDLCVVKLSAGSVDVAKDVRVKYRYKKDGSATIDLRVRLLEGVTERAAWTHTGIATDFVIASQTLSLVEAESVTDWSNVYLEFRADMP
jgi:hypothetical protein